MSDRGEHFVFFTSLLDDPDVQALSDRAFRVLVTLKGSLGVAGIAVAYDAVVAERCCCSVKQLHAAYAELEKPKPSGDAAWIRRERNVVWLVNGLKFTTTLKSNDRNHPKFIRRMVAKLGSRPIAQAFRAYYPEWFSGVPSLDDSRAEGLPKANAGAGKALARPGDGAAEHALSSTGGLANKRNATLGNAGAAASASPAYALPIASVHVAHTDLPAEAIAFLDRFYPAELSHPRRRRDVAAQLLAALTGGAKLRRGAIVRAQSADRLAAKCREVMTENVKDPDRAIVVLLTKLGDVSDMGPNREGPGALEQQHHREQERADAAAAAQLDQEIASWTKEHTLEYERLHAKVSAEFGAAAGGTVSPLRLEMFHARLRAELARQLRAERVA